MFRPQKDRRVEPAALENLEARMLLSANLTADVNFGRDNFTTYLAPGDRGNIRYTLHNDGDSTASGTVTMAAYLSTDGVLDGSDVLLSDTIQRTIRLRAGGSKTYSAAVSIPLDLVKNDYYLILDVDTTSAVVESNEADNVAVSTEPQEVRYVLGSFHKRHVTLTLIDSSSGSDVAVTFAMSGRGYGVIDGDSTPETPGYSITLKDTNNHSEMSITPESGQWTAVSYLDVWGSVGSIDAPNADLIGDVQIDGTIGDLLMANAGTPGGSDIVINIDGHSRWWANLQFDYVANAFITSDQTLGIVSVIDWTDDAGEKDLIAAPTIDTIEAVGYSDAGVDGDFEADVLIQSDRMHHDVYLGDLNVAGTVRDATIRVEGDIDRIAVGAAIDSNFLAGVEDGVTQPADQYDFLTEYYSRWHWFGMQHHDVAFSRIGSFTVTGLDSDPDADNFANSNIAAGSIGEVHLRNMPTDNGGTDFGVFAAWDNNFDYRQPVDLVTIHETLGDSTTVIDPFDMPYRDGDFVIQIV